MYISSCICIYIYIYTLYLLNSAGALSIGGLRRSARRWKKAQSFCRGQAWSNIV